jgi:hypothetical protein
VGPLCLLATNIFRPSPPLSVTDDTVLLRCDVTSLAYRVSTFRDNVLSLSRRVYSPRRKLPFTNFPSDYTQSQPKLRHWRLLMAPTIKSETTETQRSLLAFEPQYLSFGTNVMEFSKHQTYLLDGLLRFKGLCLEHLKKQYLNHCQLCMILASFQQKPPDDDPRIETHVAV